MAAVIDRDFLSCPDIPQGEEFDHLFFKTFPVKGVGFIGVVNKGTYSQMEPRVKSCLANTQRPFPGRRRISKRVSEGLVKDVKAKIHLRDRIESDPPTGRDPKYFLCFVVSVAHEQEG